MAFNKDLLKKFLERRIDEGWHNNFGNSSAGILYNEIIMSYILSFLPPEDSLTLDVGIDSGIFSEKIARLNRRVIIGSISEEQMKFTREHFEKLNLTAQIDQYALIDEITKLDQFDHNTFDLTICIHGTLSFACEYRNRLFSEIIRVTKVGAPIIFTVKNKTHFLKSLYQKNNIDNLVNATEAGIWEFLDTNYKQFEEYPNEPAYYAFTSMELDEFVSKHNCELLEMRALNSISQANSKFLLEIQENEEAWSNLLQIEKRISNEPGVIDAGNEILFIIRKRLV